MGEVCIRDLVDRLLVYIEMLEADLARALKEKSKGPRGQVHKIRVWMDEIWETALAIKKTAEEMGDCQPS